MKNKVKTIILTLGLALTAQAQQFNGTVFDLDTGRIQTISGQIEKPYQPYQPQIDVYRRIIADTQASIDRMRAESEARAQLRELREQTELLRKIADQ